MSLVHLASVCSHLQNASMARLGLTSIPYTKLHLSLALLLQKQGFISTVRLAGPSPPASAFGQGPRDNHTITNFPHGAAGRNRHSPEAALALVVRRAYLPEQLQSLGFPQDSIDFAEEHGRRTYQDLIQRGYAQQIASFITDINNRIQDLFFERDSQIERATERQRYELSSIDDTQPSPSDDPDSELNTLMKQFGSTASERRQRATEDILASLPPSHQEIYTQYSHVDPSELAETSFPLSTLTAFAGPDAFRTEREIVRDGITISHMGQTFPNQSITLPQDHYQDPGGLETEGVVTQENRASRRLWLGMKYYESKPVLSKARMISKPTKRIWLNAVDLGKVVRGRQAGEVKPLTKVGEIMAISTDRGIMEARECVERCIGGQPLCRVW